MLLFSLYEIVSVPDPKVDLLAKICHSDNRNYIEVCDIASGTKEDMRNVFNINQMIIFLEEIEDFLEQDI